MRHDAPFIVKRLAPMMGRPESARSIKVAAHAYTLAEALEQAKDPARRRATLEGMAAREQGGPPAWMTSKIAELARTATWIERRGSISTVARKRRAEGEGGG